MVYCTKCGTDNVDDATFCKQCGGPLGDTKKHYEEEWEKHCEEGCIGGGHGWSLFWGLIIILIGLWIIFQFVLGLSFPFLWFIALIIGVLIILWGFRIITKR